MHSSIGSLAGLGILALTLIVASLVAAAYALVGRRLGETPAGIKQHLVRAIVVTDLWLLATGALGLSGVLRNFAPTPPPMVFFMGAIFSAALAVGMSGAGQRFANLPLAALVGFQAFRLPLELVMKHAAELGIMPPVLSFAGENFDILVGASALVLTPFVLRERAPRWVVSAWNVFGLLSLANITRIVAGMLPVFNPGVPFANVWVTYFPYVWLPGVLVTAALLGHIVLTRKLWQHGAAPAFVRRT